MKCVFCGAELAAVAKFCPVCGTAVAAPAPIAPEPIPEPVPEPIFEPIPEPAPEPIFEPIPEPVKVAPAPAKAAPAPVAAKPEVKLLGAWAYFGLKILFSIPLVGFILLIVFSFDNSHLNRRNFARSYWCELVVGLVITVIVAIILSATGVFQEISDLIKYAM